MTVYFILLLVTAFIAYILGSMNTKAIASQFIFHKNLMRLGRGNLWLSNFMRVYGVRGLLLLLLAELARDALAIGFGMLLLSIKGHADAGAAFAGFCLCMGRCWPLFYRLRGSTASICLFMTGLLVSPTLGMSVLVGIIAALAVTRCLSVGGAVGGVVMMIGSLLVLDGTVMYVCLFAGTAVLLRNLGGVRRMLLGTEEKISLQKDLSYKFDE